MTKGALYSDYGDIGSAGDPVRDRRLIVLHRFSQCHFIDRIDSHVRIGPTTRPFRELARVDHKCPKDISDERSELGWDDQDIRGVDMHLPML
jgi:hypothetical protein